MEKKCGCKRHHEYNGDSSEINLIKLNAKKIKKSIITKLVGRGDLSETATYLCKGCVEHCEKSIYVSNKNEVDSVLSNIKENKYPRETLTAIAQAIGENQRHVILQTDSEVNYRSFENILNINMETYLSSRNTVILAFIFALTDVNIKSRNRSLLLVAMAIDCIYSLIIPKYVSLLCFVLSIVTYVICGSKSLIRTLSSFIPCGSYTTLRKFLNQIPQQGTPAVPKDRDIITFFDNNQIICKNWNVQYNSKCKVSVITTSINLLPPDISFLQSNPNLSPSVWFYSHANKVVQVVKIKEMYSKLNTTFQSYRESFINLILKKSYDEIKNNEPAMVDLYNYSYVRNLHKQGKTEVTTGDPIFLNPCSYRAVEEVLENLRDKNCEVSRQWAILGCDGLPYILGSRLIEKNQHLQNILLQPGLGHFEINMTRSCFKLLWDVIIEDLAKMLGFKSIRALTSCQRASDHHKSFQILEICMTACAMELVRQHVRDSVNNDSIPNSQTYFKFLSSVQNPNFLFLNEAIFTYIYALFLFRAGMRRCNSEAMMAGRTKFSPLFFGLHQTFYQEIEIRDMICRVSMPPPVIQYQQQHETFSVTGVNSKGEGGDFVLEAKNRKIKRHMPPGLPTEEKWNEVCSNVDVLDTIRQTVDELIGFHVKPSVSYRVEKNREVAELRQKLRSINYLSTPSVVTPHVSLSGKELDKDLANFSAHCKGNREIYLDEYATGKPIGKVDRLIPIFVTPKDRDGFYQLENQTKTELTNMIKNVIEEIRSLGDTATSHYLQTIWDREIKCGTKKLFLNFYAECIQTLQNATENTEYDEEDD